MVTTVGVTLRQFLLPFADHLHMAGWRIDALARGATACAPCTAAFDRVFDIGWHRGLVPPIRLRNAVQTVRTLLLDRAYDIVHVHTPNAAFMTRLAVRSIPPPHRPKVIYTVHGFHFHRLGNWATNAVYRSVERAMGTWTDRLVVMNSEDWAVARTHGIVPPERLVHIPGIGLDVASYACGGQCGEGALMNLGLGNDDILFSMVAEFSPGKRHIDLIKAVKLLGRDNIHVALAGDGPRRALMERLCEQLRVQKWVHFLGHTSRIPELLSKSRASVLPSIREGLPRSVMESMAAGVPVIGANVRGTQDLIDERSGILVPPTQPGALAGALGRLADDPQLAATLGRGAAERVKSFSLGAILPEYERLYLDVLGS